jgi:hypothetical protein
MGPEVVLRVTAPPPDTTPPPPAKASNIALKETAALGLAALVTKPARSPLDFCRTRCDFKVPSLERVLRVVVLVLE